MKAKSLSVREIQNPFSVPNASSSSRGKSRTNTKVSGPDSFAATTASTKPALKTSASSGSTSETPESSSNLCEAIRLLASALTRIAIVEEKRFEAEHPQRIVNEATIGVRKKPASPAAGDAESLFEENLWLGPREKAFLDRQGECKKA